MDANEPELLDWICGEAKTALEHLRLRTSEEIHNYPPPIAACDLQFNHLLEQRTNIAEQLRRLAQIGQARARRAEYAEAIDEFLRSCAFIDEQTKKKLHACLKTAAMAPTGDTAGMSDH